MLFTFTTEVLMTYANDYGHRGYAPSSGFWHPGWIALMILGFIFWWPVGLVILGFIIGSRKMGCWNRRSYDGLQDRFQAKMDRMQENVQEKMDSVRSKMEGFGGGCGGNWRGSSGNRA